MDRRKSRKSWVWCTANVFFCFVSYRPIKRKPPLASWLWCLYLVKIWWVIRTSYVKHDKSTFPIGWNGGLFNLQEGKNLNNIGKYMKLSTIISAFYQHKLSFFLSSESALWDKFSNQNNDLLFWNLGQKKKDVRLA